MRAMPPAISGRRRSVPQARAAGATTCAGRRGRSGRPCCWPRPPRRAPVPHRRLRAARRPRPASPWRRSTSSRSAGRRSRCAAIRRRPWWRSRRTPAGTSDGRGRRQAKDFSHCSPPWEHVRIPTQSCRDATRRGRQAPRRDHGRISIGMPIATRGQISSISRSVTAMHPLVQLNRQWPAPYCRRSGAKPWIMISPPAGSPKPRARSRSCSFGIGDPDRAIEAAVRVERRQLIMPSGVRPSPW